jgi:hypothetical protein
MRILKGLRISKEFEEFVRSFTDTLNYLMLDAYTLITFWEVENYSSAL